jgi:hypothetical protein
MNRQEQLLPGMLLMSNEGEHDSQDQGTTKLTSLEGEKSTRLSLEHSYR